MSTPQPKPDADRPDEPNTGSSGSLGDAWLVARIRSGEQEAMAELYDRYSPMVYAVALRVLGDTGAAEDVLQEVFMQLWRNPSSFDAGRGHLGPWLAVIARHRAIDSFRKRRPETNADDVVISVDAELEDATERSRVVEKVRTIMNSIPASQRQALEMAFFEGMTHTEIAAKTGEPLGTVKTRIRTALTLLRKALNP